MRYTVEQRVFIFEAFVKQESWTQVRTEFSEKYPGFPPPSRSGVYKLATRFRSTGSVLTEEVVDDIENDLVQQVGLSPSTKPYGRRVVYRQEEPDAQARLNYCMWFQQSVHDGIVDPYLVFFSDETWFGLSGYINKENDRHWLSENPQDSVQDEKIGVWCAFSGRRVIGPIFFEKTVNCRVYVDNILAPFFNELTDEEKSYGYFMQNSTTAHTADLSMREIHAVFGDRVVSHGLWPPRSPDLNPCEFYLWGLLKGRVYANNPRTMKELINNIQHEVLAIKNGELCQVIENVFKRYEMCQETKGHHFEHYF